MPRIFELFGYHVEDKSAEAEKVRRAAKCPFMDSVCDGGGNRHMSAIRLKSKPDLQRYFGEVEQVQSGVCSLQMHPDENPWVVCPRRLLTLWRENSGECKHQDQAEKKLFGYAGFPAGTRLGVWQEVKLKYHTAVGAEDALGEDRAEYKSFDYTFDYIVAPLAPASQSEIEALTGVSWAILRPRIEKAGYALAKRGGQDFVEDFPKEPPIVVEIMTCSTSGGNKDKRTTIPMAFEDAILGKEHTAPGINYRQVWARMVSQLIVKSEVGIGWGGKTFWILQDALVRYISETTNLNIREFLAEKTSEVNMLCLSYGEGYKRKKGIMELKDGKLFAGPISTHGGDRRPASFEDMIHTPLRPEYKRLVGLLLSSKMANKIVVK
jgi:hypothetical protein